jgi:hypothetical protein
MSFIEVLNSYKKCQAGKKKSFECTKFEYRLGYEITKLSKEIDQRKYTPSKGKCFWVTYPKNREIWASDFRDRVVHHLIVDPLEKIHEPRFSAQSFACRKNKGPFKALKELQKQVRRISQGGSKIVSALQLDIKSFFITIDREILKQKFLLKLPIRAEKLDYLIRQNFAFDIRNNYIQTVHKPNSISDLEFKNKSWLFKNRAQGIPIGNLTSQFGANLYLNSLDHFIQRTLNVKGYLRYMDDLLLLDTDLEKLKPLEQVIQEYLQTLLKQSLNFDKTDLVPLTKGITYLGYECKQIFNQKEPLQIYAPKNKKWQLIAELKKIEHKIQPENDKKSIQKTIDPHPLSFLILKDKAELASVNSRLGLLKYTNSTRFKKYALDKFKYNLTENKNDPSGLSLKYCPIEISKEYGSLKFK